MVQPNKDGPIRRRLLTISLYALLWSLLTVLSPLWLVGALIVGVARRRSFITLRLLVFAWIYFGMELVALVRVATALVRHRGDVEARNTRLFELQQWWAIVLLRVASTLLELRFEIAGARSTQPGPALVLMRHSSILDTLLPAVFIQAPYRWPMRYVLKQELLVDPCIDIVGNAMPNYFVDRNGQTERELAGIRALVRDLGEEGVLIYPEGTRFSTTKRERALARLGKEAPSLLAAANELTHVLPPRPGGVLTLLDSLPGIDCVFFAHSGLEAFEKLNHIFSGAVVRSTVRGYLWRIPASEIPTTQDERLRWLYLQWTRVNDFVRDAQASG